MNLVNDPWVSVIKLDGTPWTASLLEVFTQGQEFSDLAVRPHERIALMRLLICIAQAALDGPNNGKDWEEAPEKLPGLAKQYFEKWIDRFELFYDPSDDRKKFPFLQVATLEKPIKPGKIKQDGDSNSTGKRKRNILAEGDSDDGNLEETFVPIAKLDLALASGANTTLFDHFGGSQEKRTFSAYSIPLMLITFENFSPGGTIGVGLWNEKPTHGWTSYPKIKPGQSNHAPCLPKNMLHSFIRRNTVLNTVCANLLTKNRVSQHFNQPIDECWGKPIWEDFPSDPSKQDSTKTYLGRLIPITRAIRLLPGGAEMLLANGLEYPSYGNKKMPFCRETSATEILNRGKNDRILLGATLGKAIWRELSALIISRRNGEMGGALSLENIKESEDIDLWVGALVADKANVLDTVESVLPVPASLRNDTGRHAYEEEIKWAERVEGKLITSVREYRKQFDGRFAKVDDPELAKDKKKKAEMEKRLRTIALSTTIRHYWTAVEKIRPLLMDYVVARGMPQQTLEQIESTAEKSQEAQAIWQKAVRKAARESYALACGQETPRQIRAFAFGLSKLVGKPRDQHAEAQGTEIEESGMEKTEE